MSEKNLQTTKLIFCENDRDPNKNEINLNYLESNQININANGHVTGSE